MSKVITFSRTFPSYHPRKGEPTYVVEKIHEGMIKMGWKEPEFSNEQLNWVHSNLAINIYDCKYHTIRAGHRFKVGDWFSPRVWSGKPYNSKQIIIAPDIQVKKIWDLSIVDLGGVTCLRINDEPFGQFNPLASGTQELAKNDGLTAIELIQWFSNPEPFGKYQIICWNENINY